MQFYKSIVMNAWGRAAAEAAAQRPQQSFFLWQPTCLLAGTQLDTYGARHAKKGVLNACRTETRLGRLVVLVKRA